MSRLKKLKPLSICKLALLITISQSCSRAPVEIAPWDYAPTASDETWTPQEPSPPLSEFLEEIKDLPTKNEVLSLAELIDLALKNNPETKNTWAKAREAAARYGISRADYYPFVDFRGDVSYLHQSLGLLESGSASTSSSASSSSASSEVDSETSYGGNISLKYTLIDFGVRSSKANAAMQALHYANWSHNEKIQEVMQTASSDYYEYLYDKANLEALRVDLEDSKISFDAATQKLQTGVDDVSGMLQARTQYLQKQLQVTSQMRLVENSFIKLVNDLGLPSDIEFQVRSFPEHPDLDNLNTDVEKLIKIAKSQRPDIMAAKADVQEKQAKVSEAKALRLPKIDTDVVVGRRWYNEGIPPSTNYSVKLELSFPIFAGFLYTNQVREAEEALDASLAQLRETELNTIKDVMTYYNDFSTAKDLIYYSQEYVDSAKEEFTAVLSNYEMGTKDILDVLSAQTALADARAKYIQTKKDLFVSITNLAYATGTLDASEYEYNQFNFLLRKESP